LSVVAVAALTRIALWFKKPHGGAYEPLSIASVAAIAGHPEVVRDFNVGKETTTKELKKLLEGKEYKLGEYQTASRITRFGLIPATADDQPAMQLPAVTVDDTSGAAASRIKSKVKSFLRLTGDWKQVATYIDILFIIYLSILLGLTAAYIKDVDKAWLAKMFGSSATGRRIFFAAIAIIASTHFSKLERDTQTLAPYMRLQQMNATPTPTILLQKHSLSLTSFFPLMRNRHFIPATLSFVALLSEFLVVTLSGLPYRPGQLRSEFFFCGIASLTIIAAMMFVVVVVNSWRRLLPHLPREPNTVATVMTYVANSNMCADFEGLEKFSTRKRDKHIGGLRKRYGYGLMTAGREEMWAVDEMGGDSEGSNDPSSTSSSNLKGVAQGLEVDTSKDGPRQT
ncbi:hypothetical protein K469DRAFT_145989, partial [Zopfia rhizophila CBS 207.26]